MRLLSSGFQYFNFGFQQRLTRFGLFGTTDCIVSCFLQLLKALAYCVSGFFAILVLQLFELSEVLFLFVQLFTDPLTGRFELFLQCGNLLLTLIVKTVCQLADLFLQFAYLVLHFICGHGRLPICLGLRTSRAYYRTASWWRELFLPDRLTAFDVQSLLASLMVNIDGAYLCLMEQQHGGNL